MTPVTTTIADAQRNMRFAYFGGAPGLLASALAWLAAGTVAVTSSAPHAALALLVGGMLIHPVGVLVAKALGRPGSHVRGNPLGTLALEGTFLLLLCLPLAYAVALLRVAWFCPAMLLVIGGRYLTFASLYGIGCTGCAAPRWRRSACCWCWRTQRERWGRLRAPPSKACLRRESSPSPVVSGRPKRAVQRTA